MATIATCTGLIQGSKRAEILSKIDLLKWSQYFRIDHQQRKALPFHESALVSSCDAAKDP